MVYSAAATSLALRSLGSVATYRRHQALQSNQAVDNSSFDDDDDDEVPAT